MENRKRTAVQWRSLASVLTQKFVKLFVTFFAVIPAKAGIQSL
jgi:hypothetical protein